MSTDTPLSESAALSSAFTHQPAKARPEALIQLSSPLIQQAGTRVAAFALKNRVPAISMFGTFVDAGGLMA